MPRSPRLAVVALLVCASACAPQGTQTSTPPATSPAATPASPLASGTPSATAAPPPTSSTPTSTATACTSDPHAHVYNPDRLRLLAPCVTVTGTIAAIRVEADGDDHVLLRIDPGQFCDGQDCLDAGNRTQQQGDLILEPVCEHEVTQADAVAACAGYHNPLVVPSVGTHTTVTGPWVYDADHGWNEIHPVEAFGGQPAPSIPPATSLGSPPPSAALSVRITTSNYGLVAATTAAGASCTARAVLPSGRTSTAAGLQVQQTAAADGSVSWPYRTVSTTTAGTGTHTVTCTLNGTSASASASFTVP